MFTPEEMEVIVCIEALLFPYILKGLCWLHLVAHVGGFLSDLWDIAKKQPLIIYLKTFRYCIQHILVMAGIFLNLRVDAFGQNKTLFLTCCIASVACGMLRLKMMYPEGLRKAMTKKLFSLFAWADRKRNSIAQHPISGRGYPWGAIGLWLVMLVSGLVFLIYGSEDSSLASASFLVAMMAGGLSIAITWRVALLSCRALLFCWVCQCSLLIFLIVTCFSNVLKIFEGNPLNWFAYALWLLLYCIACVLISLIAVDDTAKMACTIINTVTTIATIVGNVLLIRVY